MNLVIFCKKSIKNMRFSMVIKINPIGKRIIFMKFNQFGPDRAPMGVREGGPWTDFLKKLGPWTDFFWKNGKFFFCDFLTIWARTELNRFSKNPFFLTIFLEKIQKKPKKLPKIANNDLELAKNCELNWTDFFEPHFSKSQKLAFLNFTLNWLKNIELNWTGDCTTLIYF